LSEPEVITPSNPEADKFYEGAYVRIIRSMTVLAAVFTIAAEIKFAWHVAGGFLAGCGLAALNFLWIKKTVFTLATRIVEPPAEGDKPARKPKMRFVLRYALLAGIAYVIFKSSILSLAGVMVGLFLPVAAILIEAGYETYAALRHGL
jgi:hypothetical protein